MRPRYIYEAKKFEWNRMYGTTTAARSNFAVPDRLVGPSAFAAVKCGWPGQCRKASHDSASQMRGVIAFGRSLLPLRKQ